VRGAETEVRAARPSSSTMQVQLTGSRFEDVVSLGPAVADADEPRMWFVRRDRVTSGAISVVALGGKQLMVDGTRLAAPGVAGAEAWSAERADADWRLASGSAPLLSGAGQI
jgi:hypothetical protein